MTTVVFLTANHQNADEGVRFMKMRSGAQMVDWTDALVWWLGKQGSNHLGCMARRHDADWGLEEKTSELHEPQKEVLKYHSSYPYPRDCPNSQEGFRKALKLRWSAVLEVYIGPWSISTISNNHLRVDWHCEMCESNAYSCNSLTS